MRAKPRPDHSISRLRLILGGIGAATLAYGAFGLLTEPDIAQPVYVGKWLVGGLIGHDVLLAPAVFILCAVAYRLTGAKARGRMAFILLVGGSLLIVGLPGVLRKGRNANPTVLPLDYSRNLAVLLALLIGGVLLVALGDRILSRRRNAKFLRTTEKPPGPDPADHKGP